MVNDFIFPVFACFLTVGPSDADTYPNEFLIANLLHNRINAVVSTGAPTQADANSAQRQVQVVVHHDQVFELHLEFSDQAADADAAVIHKGLRLSQHNVMTGKSALGDFGMAVTSAECEAVFLCKAVDAHKPDVMAIAGVFNAGIPQPDDQPDFSFSVPEWQVISPRLFVRCPVRGRELIYYPPGLPRRPDK